MLPNKEYGKNWFNINKVFYSNKKEREKILALPVSNPYKELYQDTKSWWRIVDPKLIFPESDELRTGTKYYRENIVSAENFHDEINGYFHDNTYIHYGKGHKYLTWYNINIDINFNYVEHYYPKVANQNLLEAELYDGYDYSFNSGRLKLTDGRLMRIILQERDDDGDGTVPSSSMHLDRKNGIRSITIIDSMDHGSSYNHILSRLVTVYGICKMVNSK